MDANVYFFIPADPTYQDISLFTASNYKMISSGNVHTSNHTGGIDSRQIGHCNLSLIQLSRQVLWKICRQGVTM